MLPEAFVDRHGINLTLGEDEGAITAKVLTEELDLGALLPTQPGELLLAVADVLGNSQPVLVAVVRNLCLVSLVRGGGVIKQACGAFADLAIRDGGTAAAGEESSLDGLAVAAWE